MTPENMDMSMTPDELAELMERIPQILEELIAEAEYQNTYSK